MKELGWVEGQNLIVEWRGGESADQLRAAAKDLVRLQVDVIVTSGAGLARGVHLETKTIPIVVQNGLSPRRRWAVPRPPTHARRLDLTRGLEPAREKRSWREVSSRRAPFRQTSHVDSCPFVVRLAAHKGHLETIRIPRYFNAYISTGLQIVVKVRVRLGGRT